MALMPTNEWWLKLSVQMEERTPRLSFFALATKSSELYYIENIKIIFDGSTNIKKKKSKNQYRQHSPKFHWFIYLNPSIRALGKLRMNNKRGSAVVIEKRMGDRANRRSTWPNFVVKALSITFSSRAESFSINYVRTFSDCSSSDFRGKSGI